MASKKMVTLRNLSTRGAERLAAILVDRCRDQTTSASDLDLQRAMIIDRVAQTRADLALDLMWRFMDLAEPAINRVDDSNGELVPLFDPEAAEFDVCRMRKAGSELETRVRVRDHGVTITGE